MSTSMPFDSRTQSPGYDIGPDEDRHFDSSQNNHNFRGGRFDFADFENTVSDHAQKEDFVEVFDETPRRSINMLTTDTTTRNLHKLYKEENRLKTFKGHWKDGYSVFPSDLARDGFIYCGPGDRVQCVFCSYRIWDWEPGDSVEREHRKYYPNCPFVRGQCEHLNIPNFVGVRNMGSLRLHLKTSEGKELKRSVFSNRLKSFEKWPKNASIRPDALADAGFVCLGTDDHVQCFSCHIILSDWQQGDDPWLEHARWSPDCHYVLSIKGAKFVNQVKEHFLCDNSRDRNCASNKAVESEENKFAISPSLWDKRSACGTREVRPLLVKETKAQIEDDLKNTAVMAVMQTCDIPMEQMRKQLQRIRITQGSDYKVTTQDFQNLYIEDDDLS